MYQPDENAPTLPNRPDGRNAPASPPPYDWVGEAAPQALAPAQPLVQEGQPPRWDLPLPTKVARQGTTSLRGFGVGFAVALVILAVMALGLAAYIAISSSSQSTAATATSAPTPTLPPNAPTYTPPATATPLPDITSQQAQALVTQFYTSINTTQYQQAYDSLGATLKKQQTLQQFTQSWQNTTITPGDDISATSGPDKGVTVTLHYQQVKVNGKNASDPQTYFATLVVDYDNKGQIVITSIDAQQVQTTPTPTATSAPSPTSTPATVTPSPSPVSSPSPSPTSTGKTPTPTNKPKP